jgi:hypothetical protein
MSDEASNRWEIPENRWDEYRETIRDRLVRSARLRHRIAYSNLISGLPFVDAHSHALAAMLGEISTETVQRGGPMLSALAVYISGDRKDYPGPGFFSAAEKEPINLIRRGLSEEEQLVFWANQVAACYEYDWMRSS